MILTGHQPNYLPYPGFFHKVARADRFLIVDTVQFVKRGTFGWMHRNRIRTGSKQGWDWLSVPVLTKGKYTQRICDAMIQPARPWGAKHWRTIEWNYRRAKYFDDYAAGFRTLYEREWSAFADMTCGFIELILKFLGIRRPLERASALGLDSRGADLIPALCRAVGADTYLSGIHGRDYLDPDALEREGVRVVFQDYAEPTYPQCWPGPFVPNLSVIDLIFNCGPDSFGVLMGDR